MGHGRGFGGGHGGGGGGRRPERGTERALKETGNDKPKLSITDRQILEWFSRSLGQRWITLTVAVAAMILGAFAEMAPPRIVGYLVDDVFIGRQMDLLGKWLWLMLGCFVATAIFNALRMNLMHVLGQQFVYAMRVDTYRHLQKLSLSYYQRNKTGDLMSRLSNDVNAVEDMVVHGTDTVISDLLRTVITVVMLFVMSWKLALIALIPLPLFVGSILIFSRIVRPIYNRIREDLGEINAQLEERIAGILVIKAFGREDFEYANFERASGDYLRASVRGIRLWSTFFPALTLLTSAGLLLVMWKGAPLIDVAGEKVTTGVIMAFIGYLQQFYWRFGGLIRVYDVYNRALAALSRIFEITSEVAEVQDQPDAEELTEIRGQVELEHVTFRYATGDIVLRDVSVRAEPGETVALVGRSGAGKTSLVNLIPRFYDPLEGTIRVDGHDLRTVTQKSLRTHIAMVLQETFLFNGSVRENVAYGKLDASDEEILAACQAAYADEFIQDLPEKYETEIGERGVKLSGGQKQRLAIARALLADPRILILDEATSLVDTEAEQMIQQALDNLMVNRTTFVIAHRLSTVRKANKIVVINDGEVVEEADHETLMARRGLYAEMVERQFHRVEDWSDGTGPSLMGGQPQ
jgi:subfamily B ATP-binding cassette protein MsbA